MICKTCPEKAVGQSKYCAVCRDMARSKFIEMIKEKEEAKAIRFEHFTSVLGEAIEAGNAAGNSLVPIPMVVEQHEHNFDDASEITKEWYVADGICGFAWIDIVPANHPFANFVKKYHDKELSITKGTHRGISIHVHEFGQSYQRKTSYAAAFAAVLRLYDIPANAGGMVD